MKYISTAMRYTLPEPMIDWLRRRREQWQTREQERQVSDTIRGQTPSPHSNGHPAARYKVAVIGAGGMGQDQCLGMQTLPQIEIVAVADTNPKATERLCQNAQLTSTRAYTSAEALLEREAVDMVCVATNTTSHLAVARLAVEAGVKRLIVEKPIGNSVAQARRLEHLCTNRGVKLAVNHSRRWSNDYTAIKRCVEHGYIGALRQIYAVPGPGGLAMIGVHFFDLAAYLIGSSVSWVIGSLDNCGRPNRRGAQFKDPGGYAVLGFQNGARGYLDVSDDLNRKGPFVALIGEAGRIEVDERLGQWRMEHASLGSRTFQFTDTTEVSAYFTKVAAEMLSEKSPSCGAMEGIAALEAVVATHLSASRNNAKILLPLKDNESEPEFFFP